MSAPRIVSLVSSATEILFALGLGEQVVGVSHECDWPAKVSTRPRLTRSRIASSANSGAIDLQVRSLMEQGSPLYELDVELLESLAPDLIVTQAQCDVCAVRYQVVESAVRGSPRLAGTRILALSPTSLAEVLQDIIRVGQSAGAVQRAASYVAELQSRVDKVGTSCDVADQKDRPRVCVIEWFDPIIVAGNWVPELIALAGGENGLSVAGAHSPCVDADALRGFDPQVLVLAPCGFDVKRARQELPTLTSAVGFMNTEAVRTGRVHIMDGNAYFNRPGPRLVDTLEVLAELIRPGRYLLSVAPVDERLVSRSVLHHLPPAAE